MAETVAALSNACYDARERALVKSLGEALNIDEKCGELLRSTAALKIGGTNGTAKTSGTRGTVGQEVFAA